MYMWPPRAGTHKPSDLCHTVFCNIPVGPMENPRNCLREDLQNDARHFPVCSGKSFAKKEMLKLGINIPPIPKTLCLGLWFNHCFLWTIQENVLWIPGWPHSALPFVHWIVSWFSNVSQMYLHLEKKWIVNTHRTFCFCCSYLRLYL